MTVTPAAPRAAPATTVTPEDPRYPSLLEGYNHRFRPAPEQVRIPTSTAQVVEAVEEAVAAGQRIAVRSGGHCFEDFAAAPDTGVLLDLSQLSEVYYDPDRRAVAIGTGATLGRVYAALFKNWAVTIPGGTCFEVGAGGHILAGGYGHLSRRDGLVVDHLYAVEVVVVDGSGRARAVVATREPDDPHRDLWWAHTGGGGGSFGVVTRFWMRSPGTDSRDPSQLLPRAPTRVHRRDVFWSWESMNDDRLTTLLRNYGGWYARNSVPGTAATHLWSNLIVTHRVSGMFGMTAVVDHVGPEAEALLEDLVGTVTAGVGGEVVTDDQQIMPWWSGWMPSYNWPSDPGGRYKHKAGLLRGGYREAQLAAICRYLTDPEYQHPTACLVLTGYGGQVNAVGPDQTAVAARDCVLKAAYSAAMWRAPEEDDMHIDWVRRYYRDVYAETGGVPVPDGTNAGSYIGYPDIDLADPAWNRSGVAWSELYFLDNGPQLARVKADYDPRNVFRHRLSIHPADRTTGAYSDRLRRTE